MAYQPQTLAQLLMQNQMLNDPYNLLANNQYPLFKPGDPRAQPGYVPQQTQPAQSLLSPFQQRRQERQTRRADRRQQRGLMQPPVNTQQQAQQQPQAQTAPGASKANKAAIIMGALSNIFAGRDPVKGTAVMQQQMMVSEEAQRIRNQRIQAHEIIDQRVANKEISAADATLLKNNPELINDYFKGLLTPADPKPISDLENQLRDEFTNGSGEFIKVRDAYSRVDAAGRDPSAAGDLALIFNYMKMLDPGSTVREGEFANAQNSAGVPERIRAEYGRILRGERLTNVTRGDFLDRSDQLYKAALKNQKQLVSTYTGIAQRNKADVENVVIPYEESVADIVFANDLRLLDLTALENYDRSKLSNDKAKILDKIIKDKKAAPTNTDETTETIQVIPDGSVVIGSLDGKIIYRTPDGEEIIQE